MHSNFFKSESEIGLANMIEAFFADEKQHRYKQDISEEIKIHSTNFYLRDVIYTAGGHTDTATVFCMYIFWS